MSAPAFSGGLDGPGAQPDPRPQSGALRTKLDYFARDYQGQAERALKKGPNGLLQYYWTKEIAYKDDWDVAGTLTKNCAGSREEGHSLVANQIAN